MTTPVVRRCPDGHFRRIVYDLVAFIADYPEQVMLSGIVQGWCPKFVLSFKFCCGGDNAY
jgi:Plavaka transposase